MTFVTALLDDQALETNESCSRSNGSVHPHPAGETMNHASGPGKIAIARSLGNTCAEFMSVTLPSSARRLQTFDSSEDPGISRTRFTSLSL